MLNLFAGGPQFILKCSHLLSIKKQVLDLKEFLKDWRLSMCITNYFYSPVEAIFVHTMPSKLPSDLIVLNVAYSLSSFTVCLSICLCVALLFSSGMVKGS